MDSARSIAGDGEDAGDNAALAEPRMDPPPVIGRDERRMHVRAYNFWVALLGGRQVPRLDAFDPSEVRDFGDHGVLLDFTDGGGGDPAIRFLGDALRREADMAGDVPRVSAAPAGTLLPRLIESHARIVTNRAPVGFEAEFVNVRGNTSLYRGILLPFSADGDAIDHVYAVINWKELASAAEALSLSGQIRDALRGGASLVAGGASRAPQAPWADGPSSRPFTADAGEEAAPDDAGGWSAAAIDDPAAGCGGVLADHLAAARGAIDPLRSAELRARSALYRALGLAYDFSRAACSEPRGLAEMVAGAGMRGQRRTSMMRIVQLVFGADQDRRRLAEYATILAHGHRLDLPSGGLRRMLEGQEGGLKAIVAAERAARRAEIRPPGTASRRTGTPRTRRPTVG